MKILYTPGMSMLKKFCGTEDAAEKIFILQRYRKKRYKMRDEYSLSVVFCATNESQSLVDTFTKIKEYNCAAEYIFVLSQTASDACVSTVKNLCRESCCRYIFQSEKGIGNAIRNAFDEAEGSHIIIWPADDGMDSRAFPEMVRLSKEHPDKIISVSRWLLADGFEDYGRIRKVINYVSQKMFAMLYKSDLTDFTNPTQIAPLKIYRNIVWEGITWDFVPEMIFKPLKLGCEFIEVPCKNLTRKEGKSNSGFFALAKYYIVILRIYFMSEERLSGRKQG